MIAHNLCNNTGDISLMCRTSLLRMLKGRYEKEKSDRKKREEGEKENGEDMKRRARVKMMMKRNDDEEDDEEPRRRRASHRCRSRSPPECRARLLLAARSKHQSPKHHLRPAR